mgnify:CR=1 FL=1
MLRTTTPSVTCDHIILHDWWINSARQTFMLKRKELREVQAKIREEVIMAKRRDDENAIAATPAPKIPSPVSEILESCGSNT